MAFKRYLDEDILKLLREIEVHIHGGTDVVSACRKAGVSDKTYYAWRKKFGGTRFGTTRQWVWVQALTNPKFPQPVKLTARWSRWALQEIEAFEQEALADRG